MVSNFILISADYKIHANSTRIQRVSHTWVRDKRELMLNFIAWWAGHADWNLFEPFG